MEGLSLASSKSIALCPPNPYQLSRWPLTPSCLPAPASGRTRRVTFRVSPHGRGSGRGPSQRVSPNGDGNGLLCSSGLKQVFASISSSNNTETSSIGTPQFPIPPPTMTIVSPVIWIGVGVGLSALFSWQYAMTEDKHDTDKTSGGPKRYGKSTSLLSVDAMEKIMEDPIMLKMAYLYLPEELRYPATIKLIFQHPQLRQEVQEAINSVGLTTDWEKRFMGSKFIRLLLLAILTFQHQFEEAISKIMANPDRRCHFKIRKCELPSRIFL